MAKKRKNSKKNNFLRPKKRKKEQILNASTRRKIKALLMFLIAVVFIFSFFRLAGSGGQLIFRFFNFLIGKSVYVVPLLFIAAGFVFLNPKNKGKLLSLILGIFILIIGTSGILGTISVVLDTQNLEGGWIGLLMSLFLVKYFGNVLPIILFSAVIVVGFFVFFQFVKEEFASKKEELFQLSQKVKETTEDTVKKIRKVSLRPRGEDTAEPQVFKFKEDLNLKKGEGLVSRGKYSLPPLDLLDEERGSPASGDIKNNSKIIKKTLDNFGIPVEMVEVNVGPTVTQYAFKPAEGIKLSKITTLSRNLSLALAAHSIRIEAPIPGKSLVSIEIPNKEKRMVRLRNLIANSAFRDSSSSLLFCLGRGVSGSPIYADLVKMPHLLVAGATGSGKTIFLNSLVLSFLYRNSPKILNFILIDPKRVEFQSYNHFPHLLTPVITEVDTAIDILNWLIKEMERRFKVFSTVSTRNIESYNSLKSVISSGAQLPYIVVIIDELADLMAMKGRELELAIVRLAQMARATGIHLVVATQRPSVEVITGLIKANITSRVTFQVASQVDSRTVLDMAGAESLLGDGDMLFISSRMGKPMRVQGSYVSEREIKRVTQFIQKEKNLAQPPADIIKSIQEYLEEAKQKPQTFQGGDDPLYEQAKQVVIESGKASASLLQRRLSVGYARAARLLDMLEERGVVGPSRGAKPRKVYADASGSDSNEEEYGDEEYEENDEDREDLQI